MFFGQLVREKAKNTLSRPLHYTPAQPHRKGQRLVRGHVWAAGATLCKLASASVGVLFWKREPGIYTISYWNQNSSLVLFSLQRRLCCKPKNQKTKKPTKKRTVVTCRSKIISLLIKMYQKWIDTLLKLEFAHIKHSCPLFFPTFLWWLGKNYKTFEKERYKHTFILTVQKRRTVTI